MTFDSLSGQHLGPLLNLLTAFPCLWAVQQWFILRALTTRSTAGLKDDCPPEQGNKPWYDGVRNSSWSHKQILSQAQRRELTFNQSKAIHIAAVIWQPCSSNTGDFYFVIFLNSFFLCGQYGNCRTFNIMNGTYLFNNLSQQLYIIARHGKFICLAPFIHKGNLKCFT